MANLNRWVQVGVPPRSAPRLTVAADGSLVRDAHGNATGGIRTPSVDVPVATITGLRNAGGSFCSLFGTTTPFDAATLAGPVPDPRSVRAGVRPGDAAVGAQRLVAPHGGEPLPSAARQLAVPPGQP